MFGGDIYRKSVHEHSPTSPPFYYLLNFNSYCGSLVTLFHFMIVNNWFVTIDMFRAVTGLEVVPVLFFLTFWCFVVLILLNVVLSQVLEIFSSVEPEVKRMAKKVELTHKMRRLVKDHEVSQEVEALKFGHMRE